MTSLTGWLLGPLLNTVAVCFTFEMIRNRIVYGDFGFIHRHPSGPFIVGVFFGGLFVGTLTYFGFRLYR